MNNDDYGSWGHKNLSCRQYAAIHLRVPDSGLDWLDQMIERARKDDLAHGVVASLAKMEPVSADAVHETAQALSSALRDAINFEESEKAHVKRNGMKVWVVLSKYHDPVAVSRSPHDAGLVAKDLGKNLPMMVPYRVVEFAEIKEWV